MFKFNVDYFKQIRRLVCAVSGIVFVFGFVSAGYAQNDWTIPPKKSLEVSLMSLREKAHELKQRNIWIQEEINNLQESVEQMKTEIAAVREHQEDAGRNQAYEESVRNLSLVEKQVMRAQMSVGQYQSELRRLELQLDLKERRKKQLTQDINQMSKAIFELKSRPVGGDKEVLLTGQVPEIDRYRALVQQSVRNLSRTEKEWEQSLKEYERPHQMIERLKRRRSSLEADEELLKDELRISFEEESILEKEIGDVKKGYTRQIENIREETAQLKIRSEELEQVLARAKLKIQNKDLTFKADSKDAYLLEENLGVVEKENLVLKEKVSELRSTLEKLQSK